MFTRRSWILFSLISCVLSVSLSGQGKPSFESSSQPGRPPASVTPFQAPIEDTVTVRYFTLADLQKETKFQDTLFQDFEKYAVVRSFRKGALTLGNLGSSHLNIIYNAKDNILTDPGFHQYDNYKIDLASFKYYRTGEAFNDLAFTPVAGKENFQVQARFSNNFANNLNLSLQLDRISQEGFYNDQATKTTAFGVGFWKNNTKKNHQLFFTFLANNNNEVQNGGVTNLIDPARLRTDVNTYLSSANTRHEHFLYALDNFFRIKSDKYKAHHQLKVEHGYYIFSDEDVDRENDTLIYKERFITDTKGIRYHMGFSKVLNNVDLNFDTKSFGLQLGLLHQWARYTKDTGTQHIHDLVAYSKLNLAVGNLANLVAKAELGLGTNAGNLNLKGLLKITPYNGLRIDGKVQIVRYDPSLIQQELSVTQSLIYSNNFSKVNEFRLGGALFWEKLNVELEFNSGLIDQPISLDKSALPVQKEGTTEYIQAMLSHRLFWRFIGVENSICYQSFTDNIYRLPKVYSIHNAFLQFPLFKKKLLARVGGLFYNIQIAEALAYMPITGGFYPSDSPKGNYPYMEGYANFKIQDFRIFIKIENLNDLIYPQEHYHIVNYPQFDWKLRMGVRWVMRG